MAIKLSQDVEEMPALNFEPVLQKIKTNLDRWGKINLTLWGKVNVIKMVISPQFNYILMMLPVTTSPQIFKRYDTIIKDFLWEGKRPRIKLSKMCSPRDKGGLGLPDPRLYCISFEMAKITRHWNKDNTLEWVAIENKMALPFSPIDRLSQCSPNLSNPIMAHSKEIWTKIHNIFKLSHFKQSYSSLWYNPMIKIGKTSVFWKKWYSSGICNIADLFEDDVFISYSDLVRKYKLKGKDNFWKYLQIRSCITSKIQYGDGNHIMDYFKLPGECKRASSFYRKTNQLLSFDCHNLKVIWEKDLGCIMEDNIWLKIISDNGKYIREAKGKLTQYKIIHRYYFTPLRLYRMGVMNNSLCWKCQKEAGTLLHCIWQCPCIQPFWRFVLEYLGQWAGRKLPVSPRLCLLGDRSQLHNMSSKAFSVIMVGITVAARTILKHWKTVTIPGFKEWANAMIKQPHMNICLIS